MNFDKNTLNAIENGDVKLVSVELFYDDKYTLSKMHYLRLEYRAETDAGVYRVICPCVKLPLMTDSMPYYGRIVGDLDRETIDYIGVGYGEQRIPKTTPGIIIEEVKKKTHKMTLAEIEEKLGYKIELVIDKEEE